jgi:hypothetical protein
VKILSDRHKDAEILRLRSENKRLRAALRVNSRHSGRIQRAQEAALLLATWHVAYLGVSRAECMSRGMTQRQWENGVTLLRLARVVDTKGRWLVHDAATISAAIDRAADRALAVPEAFFARGPKHLKD